MAEILKAADVSASSFQHLFRSKDGPLTELTMMVFQNQFGAARGLVTGDTSPAQLYAPESGGSSSSGGSSDLWTPPAL